MTELPQGWALSTGEQLFELVRGVTYNKSDVKYAPEAGFVGILRATNIQQGEADRLDLVFAPTANVSEKQMLREADLLIATSSGSKSVVGKVAEIGTGFDAYSFGAFCSVARPHNSDFSKWVSYFSKARAYRNYVEAVALGTNINNFRSSDIAKVEIPLPPLPEQRRIVKKLDTLTARSSTTRTHLTAIANLVERYKLGFYLRVFAAPQEQVELGTLAKVGTGATPKKGVPRYYANGTVPWVTSGAVNSKTVTEPSSFITETAIQETNCKVFPSGSLLMAMYGEGKTRGQVARLEIAAATNQALAVIHELDEARIDSEYLFRFLDSIYLEIRDQAEGGVQPNLSLGKVKTFKVPLPTLDEQREIVRRIDTAFAKIDRLTADAAKALKLLGHLDQRILAKAFAGELVPQDPSDEPAEILLARIRAERAAAPKAKRGRKAKA